MKEILIIGPKFMPIPAVNGGAIEGLIDEYLQYNSKSKKYNITVYSPYSKDVNEDYNKKYNNTTFRYIKKSGKLHFIHRVICSVNRRLRKDKQNPTDYTLDVITDLKNRKELDKYDLVIVENQIESIPMYRKYIKSKLIEHLHNDYLNPNSKEATKLVKMCDEFWGVSNFICNQINKVDNNVVTKTLYNGIDANKFSSKITDKQKNDMFKKIGFNKNDFIVIYVGRLMPEKGVLELLKAFNKVEKKDNLKLLVVGGKKSNSSEIDNYYNQLVEEMNKNKESIHMYGKANIDELQILYSIANVQVVPSMWEEAFGLIVVEGMCAMNKMIVSNSGGIPEIVEDTAIIVNRDNIVNELSSAIEEIYNNQEKYEIDKNKYKRIISKFDKEKFGEKFEELIGESVK